MLGSVRVGVEADLGADNLKLAGYDSLEQAGTSQEELDQAIKVLSAAVERYRTVQIGSVTSSELHPVDGIAADAWPSRRVQ